MRYFLSILVFLVFTFACERQTARLSQYEVHGIDVSHYQARINWDTISTQDIHFAFVKATEGLTFKDSLFNYNWQEMKRINIKKGAYHFFHPTLPAEDQAHNFISTVELEAGDLPPVLDVEVLRNTSHIRLITGIRTWLYLVEIEYGIKPIIYTNLKFYNKYLAGQFDDYPVWIARYNNKEPSLACGRDWQFWQYGNRGRMSGIEGDVDFNVFNGSFVDLENLCLDAPPVLSQQKAIYNYSPAGDNKTE
jgi:lysozyme